MAHAHRPPWNDAQRGRDDFLLILMKCYQEFRQRRLCEWLVLAAITGPTSGENRQQPSVGSQVDPPMHD
jgi:hypothetical protein